ncbi:MAG: DUF429 domain-containing protein [Rubrivivax sp.]|nr:DUF429 domain-containing protein [Rubrivivax sp.]
MTHAADLPADLHAPGARSARATGVAAGVAAALSQPPLLLGVDFSCAPSRRKPITVARGRREGEGQGTGEGRGAGEGQGEDKGQGQGQGHGAVRLLGIDALPTLAQFESALAAPGPWFGAFDFPFGLPRAFVDAHALGDSADAVIAELKRRCPARMQFRALVDAWGNARASGQRLIHRRTDTAHAATSSSPLQTRYVPVGFMYYEGFARLVAAGLMLPGLRSGDAARVGVEGYPGRLAFELIGRRSYKNRDDSERRAAREEMLAALERGRSPLGLALRLGASERAAIVADASGDLIDAVLCLMQAAWAERQPRHGLPEVVDGVEGWIVGPV